MIGLMVGLLLAGLLGWYFLSRRTGGNITTSPVSQTPLQVAQMKLAQSMSDADAIAATPNGGQVTTSDGITYLKQGGTLFKIAVNGVPWSPTDPETAQRTVNAIYVATTADAYLKANTDAYNAANGTNWTTDQFAAFQAATKTQQTAAASFAESQQVTSQAGTSDPPTPSPGPGYYWNYIFQAWTPLPPNTVTAPTTESRTGRGHF